MNRWRLIAAAYALSQGSPPRERGPNDCRMCGRDEKNPTGECSFCGVYRCSTCERYHIGEATALCPGKGLGVDLENVR